MSDQQMKLRERIELLQQQNKILYDLAVESQRQTESMQKLFDKATSTAFFAGMDSCVNAFVNTGKAFGKGDQADVIANFLIGVIKDAKKRAGVE